MRDDVTRSESFNGRCHAICERRRIGRPVRKPESSCSQTVNYCTKEEGEFGARAGTGRDNN